MKKLLITLAAASALAGVAPAVAQTNMNAGGSVGISNRIDQLQTRLQTGVQQGAISRQEAQSIRPQIRQLRQLERQYSYNGLTNQERADLQQRIRSVRQQLRMADGGVNGRSAQWDNNDDYYGQGGPYEPYEEVERCESRGGLGGVIDSVLGRNDCETGLRVGQRASGNLYSLPYEYRNRFRDGNGVYYRSDGRQIYQIDARSNTVVRVFDMER